MMNEQLIVEAEMRGLLSQKAIYLARGGLVELLKRPSVGTHPRPVYLYLKDDGSWTFTFEKAIAGTSADGTLIPISCLDGTHIFEPKRPAVIDFLVNLGVTQAEAELIVSANIK